MKKVFLMACLALFVASCGSKDSKSKESEKTEKTASVSEGTGYKSVDIIIDAAEQAAEDCETAESQEDLAEIGKTFMATVTDIEQNYADEQAELEKARITDKKAKAAYDKAQAAIAKMSKAREAATQRILSSGGAEEGGGSPADCVAEFNVLLSQISEACDAAESAEQVQAIAGEFSQALDGLSVKYPDEVMDTDEEAKAQLMEGIQQVQAILQAAAERFAE